MDTGSRPAVKHGNALLNMLLGAIIGTVIFTVVGLLIPRTYTSNAILLFPGARGGGGPSTSATGDAAGDAGGTGGGSDQPSLSLMQGVLSMPQPGTSPSTAYLILTSRKITDELIQEFSLEKAWGLSKERTFQRFKERFICSAGTSGDLKIAFRDSEPERARDVTKSAVQKLETSIKALSLNPAEKNVEYLSMSLSKAEEDCAQDQKALIDFQRSVGGAPPDTQLQLLGQTFNDLQKSLVDAEVEANAAITTVRATTEMGKDMLKSAIDPANNKDALLTVLYRSAVDRETDLELLRKQYTDKHPEVVKARLAFEVAKKELEAEVARQLRLLQKGTSPHTSTLTANAFSARAKADGLRQAVAQVRKQLNRLPEAQVKYAELSTKLRDDRSRLTLIRSEYVKAQLIKESRGPQFVTLDDASLPRKANEFEIYYFTIFGFALGIVLVGLKELFSRMKTAMRNMGF